MAKKKQAPVKPPELVLVEFYQRNGYMRVPNLALRTDAPRDYKKGYEVRLVAKSQRELSAIRRLLKLVELRPGKPFPKHKQWVQPIYGRDALDLFQSWVETYGNKNDAEPSPTISEPDRAANSGQPRKAARSAIDAKPAPKTSRIKNTASPAATVKVTRRKAR
jgi:hypothetical protein